MKKYVILLVLILLTVSCTSNDKFLELFEQAEYNKAIEVLSNETDKDNIIEYERHIVDKLIEISNSYYDLNDDFTDDDFKDLAKIIHSLKDYDLDVEFYGLPLMKYEVLKSAILIFEMFK